MEFNHYSVLLNETIENLNIKPDGIYVDGTLGGGGHAYQVASRLSEKGRLIGIDQDADAIAAAGHAGTDVFTPVGGVQTVDTDDPLCTAVVHSLQGVVQAKGIW